jgi:hypothetical protein
MGAAGYLKYYRTPGRESKENRTTTMLVKRHRNPLKYKWGQNDKGTMRKDDVISIDGIIVDLDAVRAIAHGCEPTWCDRSNSCCARYEICLDPEEVSSVIGMLPQAVNFAPHAMGASMEPDNILEETEDGLFAIDSDDDGLCVLAFEGHGKAILCSIHAAALAMGLPPAQVKPRSCTLWPLTISDDPKIVSVQEDAFEYPCNRMRTPEEKGLDSGIRDILSSLFGEPFAEKIDRELARREGGTSISPKNADSTINGLGKPFFGAIPSGNPDIP